jgi:hypothetical protein
MRIHFERTGGFAGTRLVATVDSQMLPPEDAGNLHGMVEAAGFFDLPSVIAAKTPGADRFQYRLTVETPDRRHRVEVDEAAVPARLRPLLEWLTILARKREDFR